MSLMLNASSIREIDAAFETLAQMRPGALLLAADPFFHSRREQITTLVARDSIPTIYEDRGFHRSQRPDELWGELPRRRTADWCLHRQDPQGREAGRSSYVAAPCHPSCPRRRLSMRVRSVGPLWSLWLPSNEQIATPFHLRAGCSRLFAVVGRKRMFNDAVQ
jgi:hypothetical protein